MIELTDKDVQAVGSNRFYRDNRRRIYFWGLGLLAVCFSIPWLSSVIGNTAIALVVPVSCSIALVILIRKHRKYVRQFVQKWHDENI